MKNIKNNPTLGYILIVDDQPVNLNLLSGMLKKEGYNVRKVTDGQSALNLAKTELPEMILLDILMPEMDGYEVCKKLKSNEQTATIPVIFLSALSETEDKVKAFEVGGVDYISKPFIFPEVIARIKTQLNQKKLTRIIQEQNQQLQQYNQGLEAQVVARMAELEQKNEDLLKLRDELHQALAKEQEISELKSRIITTISHEYRTPLTAISLSTYLLQNYRHKWSEEKQLTHFNRIQVSVKHLTSLVSDSLFVNQTENDPYKLTLTTVDLVIFCQEIVEDIQAIAKAEQIINFVYQENDFSGEWDERLLRQILINLLSNAVKYSPDRTVVDFEMLRENNQIKFRIKDRGIGIPRENQMKLFESFYRADNVGTIQGTGLGLSIVKKCVDLLGGEITFTSELGEGTEFIVILTLRF